MAHAARMSKKRNQGGVWDKERPGRPHPFGVQWRETTWDAKKNAEVVKTKTEFFDTKEKRDARADALRKQKKKGALVTASRGEIDEFKMFKSAIGDTSWQDVVAGWRSWMNQHGIKTCDVTVDQAVDASLTNGALLVKTGNLSPDTYRQRKHKLGLFKEQFGDLKLNQIVAQEVADWIEDFDEVQSEATFNNYRKIIRAMFTPYAKGKSKVITDNPIDEVKLKDASTGHVGILTVTETAHLFKFAMSSDKFKIAIGRLALEFFIGLRFSSGCRLEKKEINFEDKGITLPKKKLKTKKRHYIDGLPKQLWTWLEITPESCWDMTARQYMQIKSDLFIAAGVPHPHNCARHSFATYYTAAYKNPGRTATILCHRNQELLWECYNGIATESNGKKYQTITPLTVDVLAKDYVPLAEHEQFPA